ncbi:MAG TPA: RidA family protein [Nitrospirae bacterium]|nr:RidA family protein [Nitrospirota bacterium]
MFIEQRLKELGIELPPAPSPVGSYTPALRTGNLLFLSGILPLKDGSLVAEGIVGRDIGIDTAGEAARQAVINALSIIRDTWDLEAVSRCIRLNGYVASAADFHEQPAVMNAASDLIREIFGESGIHTRTAVGVSALPMNSPVELDFIFEVD